MMIGRDLEKMELRATNEKYDFYVTKTKVGGSWYVEAMVKGTNLSTTMAGFDTRKAARQCAQTWAGWMK